MTRDIRNRLYQLINEFIINGPYKYQFCLGYGSAKEIRIVLELRNGEGFGICIPTQDIVTKELLAEVDEYIRNNSIITLVTRLSKVFKKVKAI